MRIPLLMTGALAALLAVSPLQRVSAQDENATGSEVSFDLFYNNLADDGDWYNTPEYGYVWQPFIAYKTDSWRPYSDGYWAQTDSGWTWVSYENFGWATYHYGRWTRLKDIGWAWVPGYQWGPGWVSWRTNDDYVGWAPLPPKVERGVYEGKVVARQETSIDYNDVEPEDDGYTANVDQDYDIGPANYCFVGVRSFGAPVLSAVLLPPQQNVEIIERTNNVTNIYYNREPNNVFVYNGGPSYNFVSAHSERPIQQLQIERVRNTSYLEEGLRAGGNPTQVRGGILQVAAPLIARRPVNFAQVKPAHVKETIAQPQVIHGWANTGANPEVVQQLHNRFKQQAQQAPAKAEAPKERVVQPLPPDQRVVNRAPAPLPAQAPGANGQRDASPEAVAARRAQRQQERTGPPAAQPGQPATTKPGTPGQPLTEEDRIARRNAAQQARDNRNKGPANGQPAAQPSQHAPTGAAAQPKDTSPEAVAARRAQRQEERSQPGQPPAQANKPGQPQANAPAATQPKDNSDEAKAARRAQRQQERAGQPGANAPQVEAKPEQAAQPKDNPDEAKAARRAQRQQERTAQPPQPEAKPEAKAEQANPQADAERDARRTQRQQERAPQTEPSKATPERESNQAPHPQAQSQQDNQEREARQPQRQPAQQPSQQANQEREARQAQRQQERAAQAQPQQSDNHHGDKDKQGDKPNQ